MKHGHLLASELIELGWDPDLARSTERMLEDLGRGRQELDMMAAEASASQFDLLDSPSAGLASTVPFLRNEGE